MKHYIYLNSKEVIKEIANVEHYQNPKDKPRVRQVLNDTLDSFIRQIDFHAMKGTISEPMAELYKEWLTNYTIKRHTVKTHN